MNDNPFLALFETSPDVATIDKSGSKIIPTNQTEAQVKINNFYERIFSFTVNNKFHILYLQTNYLQGQEDLRRAAGGRNRLPRIPRPHPRHRRCSQGMSFISSILHRLMSLILNILTN